MSLNVVMFSGGIASWATAKRVVERYGAADTRLLFADTQMEDPDLYRFLDEAAENVGSEMFRIADGRDIWQVFKDVRMLGNTRIDPCSRILKRDLMRNWLEENCVPEATTVHLGFSWEEMHRVERTTGCWAPWRVECLLTERPLMMREDLLEWLKLEGIEPPRLYRLGFAHNNCGGGCVKAGLGQFAHLLRALPEVYAEWESKEAEVQAHLGKPVTILRDRRGGVTTPVSLRELRERIEAGGQVDMFDLGGCACMDPGDAA